ncbi:SRPBCC family protein [Microbacterium sp. zg.B48]|uniref:SRPBCC family protein n=1 Tax=Microbacterium sp. zg.B185 TaxID=2969410 RepID=UPI00214AD91F|nr:MULTISPECIES: SRPBCC family protein [unclassified Microbacterium]MCR2761968.1 SRPBCC family protein [Microbacterium sp. zg.B48]MCR2811074.1 SRPBCC family protein [Microbacterium sp. zg.B185]WIM20845.1 SRPBCC family protein [Microbacterium sp. zg-B185]
MEVEIDAPLEQVWDVTQHAEQHGRWDLRFSSIRPAGTDEHGATSFAYTRRVPFHTVAGVGVSLGERSRPDGTRTSALRFSTTDRFSPIRSGRGYWRYAPVEGERTRFTTGYDYTPGWGRLLDKVARPLLGWATAWSFDRLRIWIECGEEPERWPVHSILWFWNPGRPRASRCRRAPLGGSRRDDHLRDAPPTLATLPDPAAI